MGYEKPDLDIDDSDDDNNGDGNKSARFMARNVNLHDPKYLCDTTEDEQLQEFIDSSERLTDFPMVIRFISLVVSGHSITDASIKAAEAYKKDWTKETCRNWGSRVLKDPDVKKELIRQRKQAADASKIDSAYVLNKMADFVDNCHDKKAAAVILKELGKASGTVKQADQAPAAPAVQVFFGHADPEVSAPEAPPEVPPAPETGELP
jgi:hypothetical protein